MKLFKSSKDRYGGGGGYSRFQVTGMIEIFDSGIFWGRKIWQVFFCVAWFVVGIFSGIQNNLTIRDSAHGTEWQRSSANNYKQTCFSFWEFLRLGNSAWDFWGLVFGPDTFLGFVGSLGIFLGFAFCPHSITDPRHLKSGVPPGNR